MIACTITCGKRAVARARSAWLAALVLIPCSCLYADLAQATGPEIAILKSSDLRAYKDAVEGFKATAPGNATYVEYDLRGDFDQGKRLARTIRATDSALVVAVGLKAALTAKLEIVDIPILYMMILDPTKYQLTAANMTGVLIEIPTDRQLKMIRTFLPKLRKIGVLYNPEKTATKLKEAESQAAGHAFQLRGFPVEKEKEVSPQLRTLLAHSEALWLIPDSTVLTDESIRFILESAVARQIPVIGFSPEFTRLGALLSLSIDYGEVGREAGLLAKRILNGEQQLPLRPVPVQRIRITVNQKTARYLDITIPRELDSLIDETY